MLTLWTRIKTVIAQEKGQGLAEYAVVTLIVIIPVMGSVAHSGSLLVQLYEKILTNFPN